MSDEFKPLDKAPVVAPVVNSAAVAQKAVSAAKAAVADDQIVKIRNHDGLSALVLSDGSAVRFHQGVGKIKAKFLVEAVAQGCTVESDVPAEKPAADLSEAAKAELAKVFGKAE
jgi:hypothetical protein